MANTFGKKLRSLRITSEVGLRELARMIKKSPGYISDVENGRVPPPSEAVILDIAVALKANKMELLKAASKVDPELSDYVVQQPNAADFLRMAKEQEFENGDWKKLSQWAKRANLGKREKDDT